MREEKLTTEHVVNQAMVQKGVLLLPVPSSSSIGIVESSVSMRYETRELIVSKASIESVRWWVRMGRLRGRVGH